MNYLAGVPVKIAEEWKPAKRIEIPTDLIQACSSTSHTNQDVYNFAAERHVLAFVSERRERRRKEAEERAARLAAKPKPCEEAPEAVAPPSVPPPSVPGPLPPPVRLPLTAAPSQLERVFDQQYSNKEESPDPATCLRPQMAETRKLEVQVFRGGVEKTIPNVVNLTEFEVDAGSPFDQMELKTINEVQELASVLQNAHVAPVPDKPNLLNGLTLPVGKNPAPTVPPQASAYFPNFTGAVTPNSYPPGTFFPPIPQPSSNVVWPAQTQPPWGGYNFSGGVYQPPANRKSDGNVGSYDYYNYYGNDDFNRYRYPGAGLNPEAPPATADKPLTNRSSSVPRPPATNLNKASSISVPNLCAELPEHAEPSASGRGAESPSVRHLGPFSAPRKPEGPDPRRSRTPPVTSRKPALVKPKPLPVVHLVDPFVHLSAEAKTKVSHIAEMGFPKARVARCYKKMKGDDKKLVEHLLLIQSLEDTGHPGELVELVLDDLSIDGEEVKGRRASCDSMVRAAADSKLMIRAKNRLGVVTQFRDLGFPIDRIMAALKSTSWDRDRALDILLT